MVFRVVVLSLALGACVQSEVVQCADGRTCPVGTRCLDNPRVCASDEQLTACDGHSGGDGCMTHAGTGLCNGAALGETCTNCVCLEARCGDGFLTAPEDCDGELAGAEPLCNQHGFYEDTAVGCTTACEYDIANSCSRTCGDGVVEAAFGEVCDDSVAPLEPCTSFGFDIGFASCVAGGCSPDVRSCRRIGWTPVVRDALSFTDSIASAAGHVYVAGSANSRVFVWHHDGVSWGRMDTGIDMGPSAMWAASPTDIYIVGGTTATARVAHFNGQAWTSVDLAIDAASFVWGTSSSDVWMFGSGSSRHFDGTAWTTMPAVATVVSVWASGPADYWLLGTGQNQLLHYDGTSWQAASVSPGITLRAVSGTGTQAVVVGEANVGGNSAYIQSGAGFVPLGVITTPLRRVWAVSPTDVFASGDGGVFHFDGRDWTKLTDTSSIIAIGGKEPGRIITVQAAGAIDRYNGNAWETRPIANAPTSQYSSVIGGPSDEVFVARNNAVDLYAQGKLTTTISGQNIRALGRAGDDVYAVGQSIIDRYTGPNTWTPDTAPAVFLTAVSGTDANTVFAITFNTIYRRNANGTWSLVPTPPIPSGTGFLDLWCVPNSSTCVAAGQRLIGMWNGTAWTLTPRPAGELLYSAWGSAPNDIYAAGSSGPSGALLHYDGTTWTNIEIAGEGDGFAGVFGTAANDVFAVTRGEQLYHFDGAHWSPVRKVLDATGSTMADLWVLPTAIWSVGSTTSAGSSLRLSVLERTFPWN
jgi:hypothetical protein